MSLYRAGRFEWSAALLATVFLTGAAGAQTNMQSYPVQSYGGPAAAPYREAPSSALARHIRTLASSPNNVSALVGAGTAAVEVGDIQAALGFFARAEEVAPHDGRVKAGMASAFVHNEQPQAALKFFADAVALGVPEHLVAKDRGLAYDVLGDPVRAQADYAIVLRRGSDAEVERRMALSKAIGGDRNGALAIIDPQVRRHEPAGWRTRALVLALTGDTAEAVKVVQSQMPAQARAMEPFLARLPQLSTADRALAVHYGRFPRNVPLLPVNTQVAPVSTQVASAPATTAGRPDVSQPAFGSAPAAKPKRTETAAAGSTASRPRFNGGMSLWERRAEERERQQAAARSAAAQPKARRSAPTSQPVQAPPLAAQPVQAQPTYAGSGAAQQQPQPVYSAPPVAISQQPIQQQAQPVFTMPVGPQPAQPIVAQAPANVQPMPAPEEIAPPVQQLPASAMTTASLAPSAAAADRSASREQGSLVQFADVAALVAALPATAVPARPDAQEVVRATAPAPTNQAKTPAPTAKTAETKPAPAKPAAAKKSAEPPAPAEPSRIWVQLAVAQDKGAFPGEYKRLQGKAPKLLSGKAAWTTPLRSTNRLLVGPFKTDKEARDLVNELAKVDISSYAWTSEAGQKIEKLPAK